MSDEQKVEQTQDSAVESKSEKNDHEILMPEIEVAGFVAKPWTLGKLKKINPYLENVFIRLAAKGIKLTLDNVTEHVLDLYFSAVEPLISILAVSLDVDEEKIESLSIDDTVKLIYMVYKQNEESIKNVSSLLQMT